MKGFVQHYSTSCYEHCYKVAFLSYLICKKFHLDYMAAARAGFYMICSYMIGTLSVKKINVFTVLDIHTLL